MNDYNKSINTKGDNISFKSTYDKTFKLTQPKRLNLSKKQQINTSIKNDIYDKSQIAKEQTLNTIKTKKIEPSMRQKLLDYHKYPFAYIDFLLEKYFAKKLSLHTDEEIKAKIKEDFINFFKGINLKLHNFKEEQKKKLKELDEQIDKRLKRRRNKLILHQEDELECEPLYEGEKIEDIFLDPPRDKFNAIVSSTSDVKKSIINDVQSKYYAPKLFNQALECLDGNKPTIKPPSKAFLISSDIQINKNNIDDLYQIKQLLNIDRAKEINNDEYQAKLLKETEKTVNIQKKIFEDLIKNSKKNLAKFDEINDYNDQLLLFIKQNLEKNKMFDKLTMSRLSIFKYDLETIKKRLSMTNETHESNDKKRDEIDKVEQECNDLIAKCYKKHGKEYYNDGKVGDDINVLYNKQLRSKEGDDIYHRIYYNDNPYHYHYNYIGSSIPIEQKYVHCTVQPININKQTFSIELNDQLEAYLS